MSATSSLFRLAIPCLWGLFLALSPARAAPPAVAVLYFDNQGNPDLEPLKVGLAQMLITDLQRAADAQGDEPRYTVVERGRLQALLDELELGHGGVVDPDTAGRVGRLLGARWLVLGSYFELVGRLRIDARLVRVETGEIVSATGADGARGDFMDLERSLATELSQAILAQAILAQAIPSPAVPSGAEPAGVGPEGEASRSAPGAADADPARASDPTPARAPSRSAASGAGSPTPGEVYVSGGSAVGSTAVIAPDADSLAAAVAFSEGLILLDSHQPQRAREAFEAALARDPGLEAARAWLADLEP